MPRIKLAQLIDERNGNLVAEQATSQILALMKLKRINQKTMAKAIGMTEPTFTRRVHDNDFRLCELARMSRVIGQPILIGEEKKE